MRKWLNNYFEFTRKEFNGLMVLLVLIAGIAAFPSIYGWFRPVTIPTEAEQLSILKFAVAADEKNTGDSILPVHEVIAPPYKDKPVLFYFDPNVIDLGEWQQLGLSAKQAQAILNYRSKGGVFHKKEDLRKMYTINEAMYARLAPYVKIPGEELSAERFRTGDVRKNAGIKPSLRIIELNEADTTELDEIRGIGQVFARRIVMYRDRIGGFHKKEQLMEVFGIDSVKYQEIKDQVIIDASRLKKINVNTAQIEDFKNHPYIRYKQANALIAYRKQHGNYSNIADLNKVVILTPELIVRLAPYLTF